MSGWASAGGGSWTCTLAPSGGCRRCGTLLTGARVTCDWLCDSGKQSHHDLVGDHLDSVVVQRGNIHVWAACQGLTLVPIVAHCNLPPKRAVNMFDVGIVDLQPLNGIGVETLGDTNNSRAGTNPLGKSDLKICLTVGLGQRQSFSGEGEGGIRSHTVGPRHH
jgi:hypothetical protein